jgi:uncharacterized protein YgbK (DUF1537 family)
LPDGLLVSFYGDDFTGSTAVMEVLTFAGLPTVLFLGVPTGEQLARFKGYRGIGIAGVARSQSTDWMEINLPPVFQTLAGLNAPVSHYKVCSTFDSAPHVGSIGRAIDLAAPVLGGAWHPLLVAAPAIARYQAFGNLFAAVGAVGYRLDRHPTMSRHPITPMDEADVRRHLAKQTNRSIGLVDYLAMKRGEAAAILAQELGQGAEIVALDVVDDETLAEAGRLVWEHRDRRLFAVGSQGLEYALVAHWQAAGLLDKPQDRFRAAPVERIIAVSGSCSPVTAGQIAFAERMGSRASTRCPACGRHRPSGKRNSGELRIGRSRPSARAMIHLCSRPPAPKIPPWRAWHPRSRRAGALPVRSTTASAPDWAGFWIG